MATGIPSNSAIGNGGEIQITYPGKKSFSDIISGKVADTIDFKQPNSEGILYCGENIDILRSLLTDRNVCGKVDLIYIDPPFATGSSFESRKQKIAYSDAMQGADFVEFIRERVLILRALLSEQGSLYLHLDSRMVCTIKIILDEIFGEKNFRALITRKKSNPKNYTRKSYGNIADYILFYSKTDDYCWNLQTTPLSEKHLKEYRYIDELGRRHMRVPIHAPGNRNGETGGKWKGKLPPPGKHWQYKPSTLDELDNNGHIHWSANGNPRKKVYLDEHSGVSVQDIWMDFKDAHNQNVKITGYPTEKNPDLLERIIRASSHENSLILDCFAGSGTTLDIASKLGRKWIGIDSSFESIATIFHRLAHGTSKMGDFQSGSSKEDNEELLLFDESSVFDFSVDQRALDPLLKFSKQDSRSDLYKLLSSLENEKNPNKLMHSHQKRRRKLIES